VKEEGNAAQPAAIRIDRERKILGILILSLGLLVALGLAQHRSGSAPDMRVFNRFLSRSLLGFFGIGSWLVPLFLLRVGWNRLMGGTIRDLLRSAVLFVSSVATFSLLVFSSRVFGEHSAAIGGSLGGALFGATDRYFGAIGSTLIAITFLLVVLTALYDITIPRVSPPDLGARLAGLPVLLARGAGRSVAGLFSGLKRPKREAPPKEETKRKGKKEREKEGEKREREELEEKPEKERPRIERPRAETAVAVEEPLPEATPRDIEEPGEEAASVEQPAADEGPFDGPIIHAPVAPSEPKEKPSRKRHVRRGEKEYLFPPISLLHDPPENEPSVEEDYLRQQSARLEEALMHFGVRARVSEVHPGPVITRFEVEPAPGVKVQQIAGLSDDLALALRAKRIRIVAPIPGKGAVGVEIPNPKPRTVYLKEALTSSSYTNRKSVLTTALGKDISGAPFCTSLEEMPHLLIAGATGSGKSVCIHGILSSLLYGATPEEVHLVLIDPKMLEMTVYNGIPHLLTPVVTDAKEAVRVLRWAVFEMERRYKLLARVGVRNILDYNRAVPKLQTSRDIQEEGIEIAPLSYLVIVIDEFADLILTAPNEIEDPVARLAQMARAVGIHLVLATQRPSVNVITGVIKANFPSRIAFQVASKVDSRTIIDANGAEKLLGKGDMLFVFSGRPEVNRIHGAYISTEETLDIVTFLKEQGYQPRDRRTVLLEPEGGGEEDGADIDLDDELFDEAARIVIHADQGSVSLLQRRLRVGYSRAARLVDLLEEAGVVGPFEGSKAREVLVGEEWLRAREGSGDAGAPEQDD
jgi:S-DNA-T family DNA segregation ATPase FtsK/SpoIIIE